MMEWRKFTVAGKPMGKGRPKFSRTATGVKTYTPEKTASYEALVKWAYIAAHQGKPMFEGQVQVYINAYFEIPKSWSKRKQDRAWRADLRPMVKPDADNIAKVICDALNGLAYQDDKQVVGITVRKYYAEEPSVAVEVYG